MMMKRVLFTCLSLLLFGSLSAQEDKEAQSTEATQTAEAGGETVITDPEMDLDSYFIDHKVTMGEKMIMISRKYMVDPNDIYEFNDVANSLPAGFVLKIPLHKSHKKNLDAFKELLIKQNGGRPIKVFAPAPRERKEIKPGEEE
jgi:LysM repeat protein